MTKLQKQVQLKIEELQKTTRKMTNLLLDVEVNISYDLDSARTIGQYIYSTRTIRLNNNLLEEYGEAYILDTVVHEFAHAVIHNFYPDGYNPHTRKRVNGHGPEFRRVCRAFGNDGCARSSLFNDSKTMKQTKRQTRITYKCGCMTHEVSKVRHNRIISGKTSYSCSVCKTPIVKA